MKLGFVGLGQMGRPMALNLLRSEAELFVHSAVTTPYAELERRGARPVQHTQDLGQADIVFLCLPHAEAVRDVLFGAGGLAAALAPGKLVVDTSTITYGATTEIAPQLKAAGIDFIDAPVSGMEARAIEGTLTIM